jgi:hemoglobin-like flavoprotein
MTDRIAPAGISAMTPDQRRLVRQTFDLLRNQTLPVSLLFYGKLFELDPATRRLFHNDLAAQGQKIMDMLEAVVRSMDSFDAMRERLRDLGRQHAGYGVKPGNYETVIAALIWTFGQALGPDFDASAREAWRLILTEVSETMRSAPP